MDGNKDKQATETVAPVIHPAVEPISYLLGTWRGQGEGGYPTIHSFSYGEELQFTHSGHKVHHFFILYFAFSLTENIKLLFFIFGFWLVFDQCVRIQVEKVQIFCMRFCLLICMLCFVCEMRQACHWVFSEDLESYIGRAHAC